MLPRWGFPLFRVPAFAVPHDDHRVCPRPDASDRVRVAQNASGEDDGFVVEGGAF